MKPPYIALVRVPPPPPMPQINAARVPLPDAAAAIARAQSAWNATQLRDALRSARYFIDAAEAALPKESP